MWARSWVLSGALGGVALPVSLAAGCSRTDVLDLDTLPPSEGGAPADAGGHEAQSDARPRRDVEAPDAREIGPPDTGRDVPRTGCASAAECDDGVDCTVDRCDRATGTCTHRPDDALCPPGYACFVPRGCDVASYAESGDTIYSVALPAGSVADLAGSGLKYDDIALDPSGTLYAVTVGGLYTVATSGGESALVASIDRALDALAFGEDGTLYGAGSTAIYVVDAVTGALTPLVNFPPPYYSSGDVAVFGTTLFATATSGTTLDGGKSANDVLVAIDLSKTPVGVALVGPVGHACVWGLAGYEGVLYGFTCDGDVLRIDTETGASEVIARHPGDTFYGATAR